MPDDEVERPPVNPRRQELEQRLTVVENRARVLAQRHGRLAAGIALGAAAALVIGVVIYKRNQRQSVMRRMRSAIPDATWDRPEELIAQLKSQLQRAIPDAAWDRPEELIAQLKSQLQRAANSL